MALQTASNLAESCKFAYREISAPGKGAVKQRRLVSAGKEEHVKALSAPVPVLWVMLHFAEIQGGYNICGAEASSRMPALCHCHHTEDIPSYLTGNIFQSLNIRHIVYFIWFVYFLAVFSNILSNLVIFASR